MNSIMMRKTSSNTCRALALSSALVAFQSLPLLAAPVEMYLLHWTGTYTTVNSGGWVVTTTYNENNVIQTIAHNNGFTDASPFVLVYRPDKRDTAVVRASNGQMIGDYLQLQYFYTDLTNPYGTRTVRQAFINDEYHSSVIGSAVATENLIRNSKGNLTSYYLFGRFQFAIPDQGSYWPYGVYS